MDIELRLPLLRWLEAAPLAQLRQATHALTRLEAERRISEAAERAMAVALPAAAAPPAPSPAAADGADATDAAANANGADGVAAAAAAIAADGSASPSSDPSASLPFAARPHVRRFVEESVESLAQLADYLLTEQLSEAEDSTATLRAHVRGLLQAANRQQLQLLHQRFCSMEAQRATTATAAVAVTAILPPVAIPAVTASEAPKQTLLAAAPATAALSSSGESVPAAPARTELPAPAPAVAPAMPVASNVTAVDVALVAPASSSAKAAVAAEPALAASSPPTSLAVSPAPLPHFLQSDSGGNMDVLCLLLSYVGVWDLLGSASRVCRRWFAASLDPRCFRQIRSLRVTAFLEQDASSSGGAASGGDWGWNAAPTQPLWPAPSPAHYDSFTHVLVKLSNLARLDLGPRSPDGVLRAIGEGERVRATETAAAAAAATRSSVPSVGSWGFLSQLRVLSFRGCAALTDEGVRALVAHCPGHQAHVAAMATPSAPSTAAHSTSSPATPAIRGSSGGGGVDGGACPCFLHRVVQLDLSGCRLLTDRGFSMLFAHAPLLRHLDLSFCNGAGVASMQSLARLCPRVTRLNLAGGRGVTDDGLRALGGGGAGLGASGAPAGLSHLRWLSLEDCWSVTSTGMMHLSNGCRSLCALNMAGTYNGVNEPSLGMLAARLGTRLTELNFTGCPLTDEGVGVLVRGDEGGSGGYGGGLAALQSLRASMMGRMGPSAAELSDTGVATLASSRCAASLTTLDLTACTLVTDRSVHSLAQHCASLRSLTLSRCSSLSDASVDAIGSGRFSATLEQLDLSHVYQLTDGCLPALQRCTRLAELNLHKCLRISDQCWVLLQPRQGQSPGMQRCHRVLSSHSPIAAAGGELVSASWSVPFTPPSPVESPPDCRCTSLQALDLSAARVGDHGLRRLAHVWRRSLHDQLARRGDEEARAALALLSSTYDSGSSSGSAPAATAALAASSSSISASTTPLPGPVPSSLLFPSSVCFGSLTSLVLTECHGVSDEGLCLALPLLPALESLSLAGCFRVGQRGVECIARHCPRLRVLQLHQCVEVSDAGVAVLARSLPSLREIGLDELASLSDAAVTALAEGCPELRRVSLARAPGVTFHGLLRLLRACPHLERLNCALAAQLTELPTTHPDAAWQALLRIVARRGVEFLR